ncbi:MAG: RNA polymerase sigma factor [Myxococcota bacterium]
MTEPTRPADSPFSVQVEVRAPWRRYLDSLAPLRPALHRYCSRLTGNVWDGEDLAQDTLMRVFSLLGKIDADLDNPRGYLIRTATNLWIDRSRRRSLEREFALEERATAHAAAKSGTDPARALEVHEAASELLQRLAPQERAAVLLKEVFDLSLEETASVLRTSVGAVKAALHRGRGRLERADRDNPAAGPAPSRELVERFVKALGAKDIEGLRAICSADLSVELVGGAEAETFERNKTFFQHAHMVMPQLGFGENPHWETIVYDGEPMALGYRTLDGVEGINEVHRLEEVDGRIARIRCYCFCPDTLRLLGEHLGIQALDRRYRSP